MLKDKCVICIAITLLLNGKVRNIKKGVISKCTLIVTAVEGSESQMRGRCSRVCDAMRHKIFNDRAEGI